MMKIGILASGNGSNLQAIIDSINKGYLQNAEISIVISDNENAYALKRSKDNNIKNLYINKKEYKTRIEYDTKIVEVLKEEKIELVILAGYLRWISEYFVNEYRGRIMNIHPSLLPSFKGLNAIEKAYNYGVKITGVTVHFVDETEDAGPIILQETIIINENMSLEKLEEEIHKIEHKLYPKAIDLFIKDKLYIENKKVFIRR
ncbi:MAG: phosphoribosylglycinamide formyltransferase [Fusobacteria bacterium]|nr:phosphoribosylglycinamide formyltransferase [Fusobacteriota bacterium]